MDTGTIISLVIAFVALMYTALSFRRTQNNDTTASASERATMTADIKYIRSSIDDIKLENKAIRQDVSELKQQLIIVEQSTKSAHRRLDDLTGTHRKE